MPTYTHCCRRRCKGERWSDAVVECKRCDRWICWFCADRKQYYFDEDDDTGVITKVLLKDTLPGIFELLDEWEGKGEWEGKERDPERRKKLYRKICKADVGEDWFIDTCMFCEKG